mmetsp:Transcript_9033/g.8473  ORF Transcript_9033/g.8473 Transcript_9033/m.8473 type:complete len:174 (-) Transcript_9033:3621-4142(-)
MIKWVAPLKPEATFECLLDTLYSKICLSKLQHLQTPEYIQFRTRYQLNSYPFDQFTYRPLKQQESKMAKAEPTSSNLVLLPVHYMLKQAKEMNQTYQVVFDDLMHVQEVKIFFSQQAIGQYKVELKIFTQDRVVYHNFFDENTFAQVAQLIYHNKTPSENDCLFLHHLDFEAE